MPVEQNGLRLGQQRVIAIDVVPPHLDHADLGIGEILDRVLQYVGLRQKIRVEYRDELGIGVLQTVFQRPRLEARAIVAMDVVDIDAFALELLDRLRRDTHRLVRAVVQHLNLQKFPGIVDPARVFDDALGDVLFVVHRQLNADGRQVVKPAVALGLVVLIPVIEINQNVTMQAVNANDQEGGGVDGHEHRRRAQTDRSRRRRACHA